MNAGPLDLYRRLGAGLGQPLVPGASGALPRVGGPEKVRQSILTILDTDPGERVMRPGFGCGLRRYLMAPDNPATRAGIEREVTNALALWEPRVKLVGVAVSPTDDRSQVLIEIRYAHVLDGRQDILVYPFYLEQA
ncbi:MAG: GPW/gp25 family protein [Burkholderiaceae bacterium]